MFSIILTIHNKEFLLSRVIQGLLKNTVGHFEIIYVIDGCTDKSAEIVMKYARVTDKVVYTSNVFETKANNAGLRVASGEYIAIVQDDQIVSEFGWNIRITKPFSFMDVFAVTSGTAHNWRVRHLDDVFSIDTDNGWSKLLEVTNSANKSNTNRNLFSIRASANRGPLVFNHSDIEALGYFDEEFAPQDMDDHDLAFRARSKLGKIVGCYWVKIESKLEWGGTRVSGETPYWLLEANRKNSRLFLQRWQSQIFDSQDLQESREIRDTSHFKRKMSNILRFESL
jgi:glycosyltransferase involved in cell wall biosynthesis